MFTGLVESVGAVAAFDTTPTGWSLRVRTAMAPDLQLGESVAVDGVCLTVTGVEPGVFTVAAVETTVGCTTIGEWRTGRRVNLERALRASDRLGGHIVQGHVDGMGRISATRMSGDALLLDVELWDGAETLCVPKGSIAIDGVSLTVFAIPAPGVMTVSIIDHTRRHTTLADRRPGDAVNVELDVVGKYVRHLVAPWSAVADAVR
jgi:riboflavin synthase